MLAGCGASAGEMSLEGGDGKDMYGSCGGVCWGPRRGGVGARAFYL